RTRRRSPIRAPRCRRSSRTSSGCATAARSSTWWTRGSATNLVAELRIPVAAAALGGEVEQVPQRPDAVHVARVLPLLFLRMQQFRAVEMPDLAVALDEH